MAANARARSRDFSRQFWLVLCHALSECFLIVMLLVIAVVSYTATRFARLCRIRSPCMLCSRLDKVLHGKSWFSEELICSAHRLEIARLSYCQIHSKLAHSDGLCEKCFLSCSGPVGKPGNLTNMSAKEKPDTRSRSRRTHLCSCCSEPFKKRSNAHRISEEASGRSPDDGMRKVKQRSRAMVSVGHSSDEDCDQLPSGGYRKLNARRDSESEIHVSDGDDNDDAVPYKARHRTRDISYDDAHLQPMITSSNILSTSHSETTIPTKLMNTIPLVPLNTAADTGNAAKSLDPTIGHGLEEINWSQVNVSNNDLDMHLMAGPEQVYQELPKEKTFLVGIEEVGDSEGVSGSADEEATKFFATSAYDGTSSTDAHFNLNNSMKNAPGGRADLRSPRWSEVISAKETNSRTREEVRTFMSQLSSARGFDGPWSDLAASPRISIHIDEYRQSDANLEPSDSHGTSEDEGEISLEILKQQCEVNKKNLRILYKELEAERSASAVAASEAMAMINRLQVEKAAMHMEAMQYLRMMEEQADHDQEAIEKLNDLLTEREKEMLDLEAELENYESRFCGESTDLGKVDATYGDMGFRVLDSSDFVRNTFFDFEDEKAKILESLSRLEETLGMPCTNRYDLGSANDGLQNGSLRNHPSDVLGHHVENPVSECRSSLLPPEHLNDESVSSPRNDDPVSECRSSLLPPEHLNDESVSSQRNDENQSAENQIYFGSGSHPDDDNISAVTSIKQEISLLNSRFMALEADQKFLKQILISLKCSNDGEQYVQEITTHLRELRRTVTEQRDRTVL
ncbi:hypothetical protein ACQ4PT_037663 [Festuca glaucescens]